MFHLNRYSTIVWVILLLFAWPLSGSATPRYIDFRPLADIVNTPTGNVNTTTAILPIITWGGDIATIYANGNHRETQPDSLIGQAGLKYRLMREDRFIRQVERYIAGETPYLRGTLGMIALASDLLAKDPRTVPVVFYQMTWSAGGDALVVKPNIKTAKDLRGKTIAVQAYGPHVDYLTRVLKDAGLSVSDVNIKWLSDLTGTDNTPAAAFYEKDIDAAFVIIPDALALTSGGHVGTGSEDSVKGARILMSTKTANRVITDVYAVRSDYFKTHRDEVEKLAKALMTAEEQLKALVSNRTARSDAYQETLSSAAALLLDSPQAIADAEGLYADCEFTHLAGNAKFFTDTNYPRHFRRVSAEIADSLRQLKLLRGDLKLLAPGFNYKRMSTGLTQITDGTQPRFDRSQVGSLIARRQQQQALDDGELYRFEVFFAPNQNHFTADLYQKEFDRVVELASTYGGALITVEGHSDPMGFLRAKKGGQPPVVLNRIKQAAKNLSITRAQAVRDAIIGYARGRGISIDPSQFEPVGHGITQPATGICGSDPCPPRTEAEWRSNMRVVFRLIQVEAESDVFRPL